MNPFSIRSSAPQLLIALSLEMMKSASNSSTLCGCLLFEATKNQKRFDFIFWLSCISKCKNFIGRVQRFCDTVSLKEISKKHLWPWYKFSVYCL